MSTPLLSLYHRLQRWPAGTWLFSRAVCFKAPYFASIAPRITRLENGRCEGTLADRRRVRNHIGTVHAIAMCNLAELTAGLMVDASLPKGMRWIPKGMQVQYLAKARGTLQATALPAQPIRGGDRRLCVAGDGECPRPRGNGGVQRGHRHVGVAGEVMLPRTAQPLVGGC